MQNAKSLNLEKFITEVKPVKNFLDGVEEELKSRSLTPPLSFSTLPVFNRKIWGLKKGLTVIGARTSMGKSAIALQIAYDLAIQGHEVLFLSLEMTVESMIERIFCNVMEIDNYELLTGALSTNVSIQQKWADFRTKLDTLKLILTCGIGKNFGEVNELIDLLDTKPRVIIIDYIQAIKQDRNDREQLNEYIRNFRQICLKNNIAGVLCSQANRQVFDDDSKEPTLANLKSTGVLEEHADTVILLHWAFFYDNSKNENEYKIIIAKQRNGRTGEYIVHYKPQYYRYYEVEPFKSNYEIKEDIFEEEYGNS